MRKRTHFNRVFYHFNLMSCIRNFIHDNVILIVHSYVSFLYVLCSISLIFEKNCLLKRFESFFVDCNYAEALPRDKV